MPVTFLTNEDKAEIDARIEGLEENAVCNPPASLLSYVPIGEIIDNFQPGTKFSALTLGAYTATANADTEDYLIGSQSLHFTNCIQASGLELNLTGKHIRVRFKINSIDSGATFLLYIAEDLSFSKMMVFTLYDTAIRDTNQSVKIGEWADLIIPYASTNADTVPDFSKVGVLRLRFLNGNGDANIQMVSLQDVEPKENKGVVSFTFDDGLVTQYTKAAKILGARGIPGTAYIIPDLVGVSENCMTEEQIRSLKVDYGWDIESHWVDEMVSMTEEQIAAEFATVKKWIQDRGLGRGDHFAYPGGAHNDVVKKVARKYFTTARTIDSTTLRGIKSTLVTDPYALNALTGVGNNLASSSVNVVKTLIDRVAQYGGWLILVFHSIGDTATPMYCKENDLADIADYAIASGVDIKTVADVLDGGCDELVDELNELENELNSRLKLSELQPKFVSNSTGEIANDEEHITSISITNPLSVGKNYRVLVGRHTVAYLNVYESFESESTMFPLLNLVCYLSYDPNEPNKINLCGIKFGTSTWSDALRFYELPF